MKIKHLPKDFGITDVKDPLKTDGPDRIQYKQYVSLFKKTVTRLINMTESPEEGDEIDDEKGVQFFLLLNHRFPDKDTSDLPYILLGTPKADWKAFIKESLKKNKKMVARGYAKLNADKSKLELSIEQGMARPKQVKKLLDKYLFKFVGPEISFPEGTIDELTLNDEDGNETTVEVEKDMVEAEEMASSKDKISLAYADFIKDFEKKADGQHLKAGLEAQLDNKKKLHQKLELAIERWLEKIGTALNLAQPLTLENLDVSLNGQKQELKDQAKKYLEYLAELDNVIYSDDEGADENDQKKLTKHGQLTMSILKSEAGKVNNTVKAEMTSEDYLYQEAYVKGLWAKVNNAIQESIKVGQKDNDPDNILKNLKEFRKDIADCFPDLVSLSTAVANDPKSPPLPNISAEEMGKLTGLKVSKAIMPNTRGFNNIIELIEKLNSNISAVEKLSLLKKINLQLNEYILKYAKDDDLDIAKQVAILRGFQQQFLLPPPTAEDKKKKEEIDAKVKRIDCKKDLGAFDKLNSWREPSFKKIYKVLEEFNKNPSKELLQHLNRLMKNWMNENPKDKERCKFLLGMQNGWMKDILGDDLEDKSMGADAIATETTAGTTASSEKAKAIRDAKVSDRARELAKLLDRGKASQSDPLFGKVAKWLFDSLENNLEEQYDIACQQVYEESSYLMADILSVFGSVKLQSRYLIDRLRGISHPLVPLAMKLGVMGDDGSIFSLFGGKQESKDAIDEVLKSLSRNQIDTILNATESDNTYEGAIFKKLNGFGTGLGALKTQMIKHSEILGIKEQTPPDKAQLNETNQDYLCSIVDRLQNEHLVAEEGVLSKVGNWVSKGTALWGGSGGRVNPDKLIEEVLAWANGASDEEKKAILEGEFMEKLEGLAKSTSLSGFKESHLKYLKKRLEAPKRDENTEASDKLFDELDAIAEQQGERNFIHRHSNDEIVFENFKSIIKLEGGNPQLALVKRFADGAKLSEWEAASNKLAQTIAPEERQEALNKQAGILNGVMENLRSMMDTATLDKEQQIAIEEAIFSNGARGFIYQKLSDLATGRPRYDLGTTVLDLLEKVETSSAEFATIKNDKALLAALRKRILGFRESEDNLTKWKAICKILGISPEVTKELESTKDAVSTFEAARKDDANVRFKILDPEALKKQQEAVQAREKTAEFWAAKISKEYRTTNNEQHLLMLVYKAQQKGVDLKLVFTNLNGGAGVDAIDKDAYNRLFNETSDHAKKVLKGLREGNAKISAKEVMQGTISSVEVFSQNSVLLGLRNIFRTTDEGEISELVKAMSVTEIMESFFDLNCLKPLQGLLGEKETALANKTDLKDINQKIQNVLNRFDVSKETMLDLDAMMKPKHALEVKKLMRNKLAEALAKKDNTFDKLLKDGVGLSDNHIKLLKDDFPILGGKIKAISNIETTEQSETGTQWSSISSKMGQRDIAEADYLGKLWENNETLEALASLSPEDIQAEKLQMAQSLAEVEGVLTEAIASFEERKGQYDKRIQDFIATFMASIIAGISIASGVGAAAGIVQLMWAMFTPLVKNAVNQVVKRVTEGDRGDAIGVIASAEEWFFNCLADQAGAAMGFIGGNLAFALDVKMIGTLTSGGKNSGWTAWDSMLKSPVLKVAKGYIGKTFDNIGRSFVEAGTKKTKGASATDAVNELEAFGKKTISQLGTSYLKSLVMTTFTTGANSILPETLKWRNTGMAGNNLNTTGDNPRGFNSDDANFMSIKEMKEGGNSFTSFVNSLGMFDASPKLADGTAAGSGQANGDAWEFIKIPGEAISKLSEPKYLNTVINNFVWGGSEFKGEGVGISHIIGSSVDSALGLFKTMKPTDKDKLVTKLEKEFQEEVRKQLVVKLSHILENIKDHGGTIPNFADLTEDEVKEWNPLEKGKEIMFIWENMDCKAVADIQKGAQGKLGLTDEQYELFKRTKGVANAKNIRDIVNIYYAEDSEIETILYNARFMKSYKDTNGFTTTDAIENDKFKIGAAITGAVDILIPMDKNLSDLSPAELYDQWQKWMKAKGEATQYNMESLAEDMSKKGVSIDAMKAFFHLQNKLAKKGEALFSYYFDNVDDIAKMLKENGFGEYIQAEIVKGNIKEMDALYDNGAWIL